MAPARSRGPIQTSSSPLFQRTLAEAKKNYTARGKRTSAAIPQQSSGSSTHENAVSQPIPPQTPAPTPNASDNYVGAITRSKKRKMAAESDASAHQEDIATAHEGDVVIAHEDEVPRKKQKCAPAKESSAGKRKRTEEDLNVEDDKDAPRPIKRSRSSASRAKLEKKDVEKVEEQTNNVVSVGSTQAMHTVENRSAVERLFVAAARDVKDVEGIHSVKLQSNEAFHELTVEAMGFTSIRYAPAGRALATQTDKHNSEGKHADNTGSTKVNKEERKGEKDGRTGQGEKDKKEENKGKIINRTPSSRRIKKSKTSRRSHRDVIYVSDDYDTETGEPLNNHRDSDSDITDFDSDSDLIDSDSDLIDSDSDLIDSDSDMASTPATTPSSRKRPYTPRKEATTPTTSLPAATDATPIDNDDDNIPTISSKKVRRELAGLSDEEDDKASKSQHYYEAEYIDCGNGDSFTSCSTHKRKVKTAEEKRNRTEQEKQNDEMYDYFEAATERLRKAALKKAMRNYKATAKPAIQDS